MAKQVVILGAGYAGIEAALKLNKHAKKGEIEITLIDRHPYHTLLTEIHEVAGNRVDEDAVIIPLREIFHDTKVRVVLDDIKQFNYGTNNIASASNVYSYDYLVLGAGSEPNFFGITGMKEHSFSLWSLDDAVRIREHIKSCFQKAQNERDPAERSRLLSFVVGGAGFTGVEMIGELAIWVKSLCKQYNIRRKEVRLTIVDMLPRILNILDEGNSAKAKMILEKKLGVEIVTNACVQELKPETVLFCDGSKIETRTLIWAAGIRSTSQVDEMELSTGPGKRLLVDEYCRTPHKNVYAVGDIVALMDDKGKAYPSMVETALQTGHGAAQNILNDLRGKKLEPVKVTLHGTMVCISCYYAVADLMGFKPPSWLAKYMKFLVNAHYLYGIVGLSGVWRYFTDELLHRRQKKKFLEQHYTKTMQAWWAVPLRLFLGWTWFYEGLKKIQEGWLTTPKLASFLGMSSDAVTGATAAAAPAADAVSAASAAGGTAVAAVADAVSTATGAVEAAGAVPAVLEKLMNIDLGFIKFLLERTGEKAPMVFRIDFSLVNWLLKSWVLAPGWDMFFQVAIVILEILVGLALFGGAFTFIASVASLGLCLMFMTSTGMYDTTWWMLFAGILTAGGVGRAFGLDHYLFPYLNRVIDFNRKNGQLRIMDFNPKKKK